MAKYMLDQIYPPKALFEAEAARRQKELDSTLKQIQRQVAAATNSAVGPYQKYNPNTGAAGSIVNAIPKSSDITNVDSLSAAFRKLTIDGNDTHSMLRGLASGFNLLWLTWGNLGPLFVGAAISNGFMQTAKTGMQVAHTMETIAVLGGNTTEQMQALNVELDRLGKTGPFGPVEVADAMKVLSLAGLKANEILSVTQDVLNFSVAGTTDLKTAADTLVSISTAFGMGAEGFGRVADVVSKAAAESKTSVESFAAAMKTASVINKQYGVSLEDTATGLAALSQIGIEGTAAGTALRNMYADLSGRSQQVAKVLKAQGIEMRTATGEFRPMLEVVADLTDKLNELDGIGQKNLLQAILSERGAKGMVELLQLITAEAKDMGKGFSNALEELRTNIEQSYGFAAVSAAKLAQKADQQFKAVGATLSTSMNQAFRDIEPTFLLVADALKQAFGSEQFIAGIKSMTSTIAELALSFIKLTSFILENWKAVGLAMAAYSAITYAIKRKAAATAEATAATIADTAATIDNNQAKTGAAATIGTLARFLPGLGQAINLATIAWMMYDFWQQSANDSSKKAAELYNSNVVKTLQDQTAKLKEINDLREKGLSLSEAQAKVDALAKKQEYADPFAKAVNDAIKKEMQERAKLDALKEEASRYAAKDNLAKVKEQEAVVSRAAAATQAAKAREVQAINEVTAAIDQQVAEVKRAAEFDKRDTEERAERLKQFGTGTFSLAGGAGAGGPMPRVFDDRYIQELQKQTDSALSLLKDRADREQAILANKNKNLLISDAEYMAKSISASAAYSQESINILEQQLKKQTEIRKAEQAELDKELAKQTPGSDGYRKLKTEIDKRNNEQVTAEKVTSDKIAKIRENSFLEQVKRLQDIEGATRKLAEAEEDFWAKAANADKKSDQFYDLERQYKNINTSIFSSAEAEKASAIEVIKSISAYDDRADAIKREIDKRKENIAWLIKEIELVQSSADLSTDTVAKARYDQLSATLDKYKADVAVMEGILEDGQANAAKRGAERGAAAYKKVMDAKADQMVSGIADALSTAITNGAEAGKKSLWKLLQDELINKPLKAFVNIVVNSILGANGILGSAVGSGVSSAAGSLIGGAASAMGLATLAGMTTTTGLAYANATSAMGMYGGDALTGFLATNEAFGTAATTTAAAAGSLASTVEAVLPWVGGALAIGVLLKGIFGGGSPRYYLKTSSQDNAGGEGFEDGVKVQSAYGYIGLGDKWTKNIDANSMKPAFDAIAQLDNAIAAALSPQQNAKIAAALDGYVSEKNDSVETYVKGRLAIITQTLGGALNELAGMFSGTTDELATYIVRLANAQKLLPAIADLGTFGNVSAAMLQNSQSALKLADALQTTFGSTDNATAALQNYYNNFYTEQERLDTATKKLSDSFAQLGVSMPSTREAFRDLVQAQDVNTDAGRSMYASLMALSGAFANVIPATDSATAAIGTVLKDLQTKSKQLEGQLAVLQGTKTQAQVDTAGMSEAAKAVYEYNASLQSQIDAINAASKAAEADAQKRLDLENQLLDLQGNTAAIRARELAGLSATNQALQQQIWALQDAKAAQDAYNQAVQDAQQAYQTAQSNLASAQSAVKAVQDKATNAYISAQDRVATASQNLANAQQQVAQNAYDAAVALQKLGQNLKDWVQQQLTQSSDPQTAARLAASQYRTTLAAAKTGDQNAIQQLTQDAGAYLTAAQTVTASKEYAILRASILGEVQRLGNSIIAKPLPPEPAKQDPVVAAQQNLASATAEMTSAMTMALSIGAPLTKAVDDLVSEYQAALAAQQEAQAKVDATAAALAAITKNTGDTVTGISGLDVSIDEAKLKAQLAITAAVDVVMASSLPDEIKQLALGVTGAVQKTVAVTLQTASIDSTAKKVVVDAAGTYSANIASIIGASVPDSIKTLLMAGAATSNMAVTLGATMSSALTDDQRAVLNATAGTVQRILSQSVVSGALTDDQRTMLYKAAGTINSTLALLASGGTLTADQRAILQQQTATAQKTVAMYVNDGSLTAEQRKYLGLTSTTNSTVTMNGSVTFTMDQYLSEILATIKDLLNVTIFNLATISNTVSNLIYPYFPEFSRYLATTYVRGFANGGAFVSGVQAFASGGSFTNSIVSTPTYFNMGLMGEAGPEAIMPLARTADGKLGVRSTNPSATIAVPIPVATNNQENDIRIQELLARIEQATRDQKEEVVILRKRIDQQLIEQTRMSQDIARMRINGVMVYTDPAEPIQTVSV